MQISRIKPSQGPRKGSSRLSNIGKQALGFGPIVSKIQSSSPRSSARSSSNKLPSSRQYGAPQLRRNSGNRSGRANGSSSGIKVSLPPSSAVLSTPIVTSVVSSSSKPLVSGIKTSLPPKPPMPSSSRASPATSSAPISGVVRAKSWSLEVENAFRLQECGWRDVIEYSETVGSPEVWPKTGYIKKLKTKDSESFAYFSNNRECDNKYIPRVKLFVRK
eukprot:TRINITY_DN774209_c0_g1_i1.p1 TRINITY_DN774209_c0_g1~~TRINITY_DN774209_c0_g1_i1.p1  ORF type:complete len:218 (+),score=45.45 TRINITY_DN774209_c0_g1_i1:127-780(+)